MPFTVERAGEDVPAILWLPERPAELDAHLRQETPRIGLWLDTSEQTLERTTDELLARVWAEGQV